MDSNTQEINAQHIHDQDVDEQMHYASQGLQHDQHEEDNHHHLEYANEEDVQQHDHHELAHDGMESSQDPKQHNQKSGRGNRHENSLGTLTRRFLELVKSSPFGIVDLNIAAQYLDAPKRRVYDITNVLEGVEIIVKKGKNHVHWLGTDDNSILIGREQSPEVTRLSNEIDVLTEEEGRLDQYITFMTEKLQWMLQLHSKHTFATYQDMATLPCFTDQTLIAVKAPPQSSLEVPDPDEGMESGNRRYQLYVKSSSGPMDVFLINSNPKAGTPTQQPSSSTEASAPDSARAAQKLPSRGQQPSGSQSGKVTTAKVKERVRGPKQARLAATGQTPDPLTPKNQSASQTQPIKDAVIRLSPVHSLSNTTGDNSTAEPTRTRTGATFVAANNTNRTRTASLKRKAANSVGNLEQDDESWKQIPDISTSVTELFEITEDNEMFDMGNPANVALLKQLSPLHSMGKSSFWSTKSSTTPTESH